MPSIRVELGENSYPIIVDQDILSKTGELLRPQTKSAKVIVVADTFVSRRYGGEVLMALSSAGFDAHITEVPLGRRV